MARIAVAGTAHAHVGYIFRELAGSPDLQLVGVADGSLDSAKQWAAPFGAPVFADYRQMLADTRPDIVAVASIYGERGPVVLDALAAGCDVVADKPLCTTLDHLDQISSAAARAQKSVTVLFEKRYYPETLAALELVRGGGLGTIVAISAFGPHKLNRPDRPDWFLRPDTYGGILNDLTVHDIDLGLLFTGATSGTVAGAVTGSLADRPGFSLHGRTSIDTPQQVLTLEANWLTPDASPVHGDYQMRIVGTEGTAEIFWARHQVQVTTRSEPAFTLRLPPGHRPAELALRALAGGEIPDITTGDSLLATRLALLAQRSADAGTGPASWSADGAADGAADGTVNELKKRPSHPLP